MPILTITVVSLMIAGHLWAPADPTPLPGSPLATLSVQAPPPISRRVAIEGEFSAAMFEGTVHAVEPATSRVTIQTDFGRVIPITVQPCHWSLHLKPGDRVRLDVDAHGTIRPRKMADPAASAMPDPPRAHERLEGRCPGATT